MHANVQLPRYQEFLNTSQGLLQRVAAVVVFLPIGVTAYCLRRQQERPGMNPWVDSGDTSLRLHPEERRGLGRSGQEGGVGVDGPADAGGGGPGSWGE